MLGMRNLVSFLFSRKIQLHGIIITRDMDADVSMLSIDEKYAEVKQNMENLCGSCQQTIETLPCMKERLNRLFFLGSILKKACELT